MKYLFLIIGIAVIISCVDKSNKQSDIKEKFEEYGYSHNRWDNQIELEDSVYFMKVNIILNEDSNKPYKEKKREILRIRSQINIENLTTDSISNLFTDLLLNKIIPYWYGTEWSLEGNTLVPRQGEIACGYFVSTTLRDIGININRYKLAQQSPINEARTISIDKRVLVINNTSVNARILELKNILKEGIYFIGFDQSHVGYLLKRKGELYLVHSNYFETRKVEIEKINKSKVFSYYNKLYIAEISTNRSLIKKWLLNEEIRVLTK